LSPNGNTRYRFNKNKHKKIRIQSTLDKRQELDHLVSTIKEGKKHPDFGFSEIINFD
jgi:hypothetical protein